MFLRSILLLAKPESRKYCDKACDDIDLGLFKAVKWINLYGAEKEEGDACARVVTWQATSRGVAVKDFKGPDKHNAFLGLSFS